MGQITMLFLSKVLRQVGAGVDRAALLSPLGITLDADGPTDPSRMIDDGDYYTLLERIAAIDPDAADLPLRTGASMRCDDYGAFGLAFKAAVDLRHSWARAERYGRILTSVTCYEVKEQPTHTTFIAHREGERRLGMRMSIEATLASVVSISREVSTRAFSPIEVSVRHKAPANKSPHERYFGCPVRFGAEHDAIRSRVTDLRVANRLGDASISHFFDTHLQAQMRQLPHDGPPRLHERVIQAVVRSLSDGVPTLGDIAAHLGMSARTLQRRLAEDGYRFTKLMDQARQQLAERLLRNTEYSLTEIAFLTGFSEQSAFNRAFRRWCGQTPRNYRLRALGP
ncbi:MAG: AraC family transcriptional regulator ligand-binding domain-containing protein [Pseudomonadota bacterium]